MENISWNYIHIDDRDEMFMSGWKLYIYGQDLICSNILSNKLLNLVVKYNLTTKVATQEIINRNKNTNIPWSSMVIYLTETIFKNKLFNLLKMDINNLLKDYNYSGYIPGAKALSKTNNKIHYRYDLNIFVNSLIGVSYDNYIDMYRGETGDYNIIKKH